jgi:hypothetical protein
MEIIENGEYLNSIFTQFQGRDLLFNAEKKILKMFLGLLLYIWDENPFS